MASKEVRQLTLYVNEILESIDLYGKDCPAVLIYKKDDRRTIMDFMTADDWDGEQGQQESIERMPLFFVLCEFLLAKKSYQTNRPHPYNNIVLAACRMCAHISQADMARRLGIPLRTLENWESGLREPSKIEHVLRWLSICDMPVSTLEEFQNQMASKTNGVKILKFENKE